MNLTNLKQIVCKFLFLVEAAALFVLSLRCNPGQHRSAAGAGVRRCIVFRRQSPVLFDSPHRDCSAEAQPHCQCGCRRSPDRTAARRFRRTPCGLTFAPAAVA